MVGKAVDDPAVAVTVILSKSSEPVQITREITSLFQVFRDEAYAAGCPRFVPGAAHIIGVRVPILQAMARPLRRYAKSEPSAAAELLHELWRANTHEHKLLAILLLKGLAGSSPKMARALLDELLPQLTDWAVVDMLAGCLAPLLSLDHEQALGWGRVWLKSEQTWVRRLGMVIVVPLCRDKKVDYRQLADHLELARGETHPTQLKALGWCWREIGKRESELVFEQLQAWATSERRQDRRVAWSGSEKCTPQQRKVIRDLIDRTEGKKA